MSVFDNRRAFRTYEQNKAIEAESLAAREQLDREGSKLRQMIAGAESIKSSCLSN